MAEEVGNHNQPDDPKTTPNAFRVKLYKLDTEGGWEDQGTGFCIYTTAPDDEPDELVVRSERDQSPLLVSKIHKRKVYQRQQDTLIVWTEDAAHDLALSFEKSDSCDKIWRNITHKQEIARARDSDTDDQESTPPYGQDVREPAALPAPELSNLSEIAQVLSNAKTIQEKDRLASFILIENYIDKLLVLFETCEDLESIDDLHKLYTITKAIIMLNDNTIIEYIIRDEIILGVVGMLEYNPETPKMKAKHREFLAKCTNVDPVVPIKDEATLSKIHQTYRLRYLKDAILPETNDDAFVSIVHSLIFFNHIDIINHFQHNSKFLTDLFRIFKDKDVSFEKKTEASKFIVQLCIMAKSLQASARAGLYKALAAHGFFNTISFALTHPEEQLRASACLVLLSIIELDTSLARTHLGLQAKEDPLEKTVLYTIVSRLISDTDANLKMQYTEMLKILLDPGSGPLPGTAMATEMARKQDPEAEQFLTTFYDLYARYLLEPMESLSTKNIKLDGPIEALQLSQEQGELYLYICDILCFIVRQHSFRSKFLLLSTNCFVKIVQLYRCPEIYLKLAALRVIRACVGTRDDFYIRNLINHNVFEPTIRVLLDTDGRDNLLNSACLELLDYIRKDNIKLLLNHLVPQFGTVMDTITYVSTCRLLRAQYNENHAEKEQREASVASDNESIHSKRTGGWTSSTVNMDEEEYFSQPDDNKDEDDKESTSSSGSKPLVDYEDDDEDDTETKSKEEQTQASSPPLPAPTSSDEDMDTKPDLPIPKRSHDEDEDDDLLAKRTEKHRRLASPKKIIINAGIARKQQQ
ncbi:component of IIS longevity pathway SMK-1-domain-containing protein [Syncephalastrum racemosum]|uniref:Component of IIS longevity pathway SMK-1-domain-containing protein n=1 Tax=Syncephalastrum racemosum TaxID=13706 RepID=A0A1X2HGB6_SYNRA|nr:component of IIS longevity pathway SMK-1-domain-containing protein [Syncephalastrum racemosum]